MEVFRDPGGPEVSEKVREILLNPDYSIDPVTELLLFSAARSQLMAENVLPGLRKGVVVILDRFYDSTTAYQGYGRESISLDEIHKMNKVASHKREPDLTIYMKVPLEEAQKRMGTDVPEKLRKACQISIMFPVEDDADALTIKASIDSIVGNIADKRYTFNITEM